MTNNKKVDKPWGSYTVLDKTDKYWIKKLFIKKGERLSLQAHKKRKEFWTVVSGKIKATKGERILNLEEGDSLVIKKQEKHRIKGIEDAVVVEVSYGKVEENDITRFEDDYDR